MAKLKPQNPSQFDHFDSMLNKKRVQSQNVVFWKWLFLILAMIAVSLYLITPIRAFIFR